jgi:hypothetical protein
MTEQGEVDDAAHDRRLADAGAAGDHHAFVDQRGGHRAALLGGELEPRLHFEVAHRRVDIDRERPRRRAREVGEAGGGFDLGALRVDQRDHHPAVAERLADHQPAVIEPRQRFAQRIG